MENKVSRRSMLKATGVFGVLSATGTVPAWAWSSNRSVAGGDLATVPPENVWDKEADKVVRRLFEKEGISRIEEFNALLRDWHRNDQPLPEGLPGYLVAFIQKAKKPPGWIDRAKLTNAYAFYWHRGDYALLLYAFASGIVSCAIPNVARSVFHSKGGEDMRDRVVKTGKLGWDQGTRNAYEPDGELIVTCIKTRLTHSAVRYLITSSPKWQNGGDIPPPISQRDLIITWHSLATFIHRSLEKWNVPLTNAHSEGFLHLWQVTGHYLGIEDVYIPATWEDARYQSDLTFDPAIAATREGIDLAEILLSMFTEFDQGLSRPAMNAMARYMVGTNNAGESIGDMLQIPRNAFWDSGVQNGWPGYVRFREQGLRVAENTNLYSNFDALMRVGSSWATSVGMPVYIEMATENRPEDSYPPGY